MNTVYLVDDDQIVLDELNTKRGLCMECGFEICGMETNPIKALEEIRALRPDAVLSDLKMPELTGIGLLMALRRDNIQLSFVVISAYKEFNDLRKFFAEYKGFDYLLKPVSDRDLADLLTRLSAKINDLPPVAVETETSSRELNDILKYLKEYYAMNHTLESIATIYSINPNTVCNLFSRHLNTTFIAYLTSLRMDKATELLRITDMAVKDIGVNCGYTNYFYFTRVFAKTYSMTPTEYREAALNEK